MKKTVFLLLILMASQALAFAASDKKVKGEYTFYATPEMSLIQAREIALTRAQNEALRNEFGTLIRQDVVQTDEIVNNNEHSSFLSNTQSTVGGEWLATEGTPIYEERLENGAMVVTCRVEGRARKLSNKAPKINAHVMNISDKRNECNKFVDQDDLYLYINSPESDIYTMVCLLDEAGDVYNLFPFESTPKGTAPIKKGMDYILFDSNRPGGTLGDDIQDFIITADEFALNRLYVVYSPNYFRKGPWKKDTESGIDMMKENDFNKLLLELRRADEEMDVVAINFSVQPKDEFGDK